MAAYSKYCSSYIETPSIQSGFEYLLKNFQGITPPILITNSDEIITFIDQNRPQLEGRFILPGTAKAGLIQEYIDKNRMPILAWSLEIPCPRPVLAKANCVQLDGVAYPCIIKPAHENPGHYNEFKFKICKNSRAL